DALEDGDAVLSRYRKNAPESSGTGLQEKSDLGAAVGGQRSTDRIFDFYREDAEEDVLLFPKGGREAEGKMMSNRNVDGQADGRDIPGDQPIARLKGKG